MIFAIDPGNIESAYVLVDQDLKPLEFGKEDNETVREIVQSMDYNYFVIEMVASYGMPVGADVFDTCIWIGRFCEIAIRKGIKPQKLYRKKDVGMNLCKVTTARDSNVIQALVDRFAYGQPNYGKGTKNAPGWFYGFKADIWQAYALAVTYSDLYLQQEGK